jgi:hypothetical protein
MPDCLSLASLAKGVDDEDLAPVDKTENVTGSRLTNRLQAFFNTVNCEPASARKTPNKSHDAENKNQRKKSPSELICLQLKYSASPDFSQKTH